MDATDSVSELVSNKEPRSDHMEVVEPDGDTETGELEKEKKLDPESLDDLADCETHVDIVDDLDDCEKLDPESLDDLADCVDDEGDQFHGEDIS